MPIKSETSRLIDAIIMLRPAPFLKKVGYRKIGRSFHAQAGELIKVVQFQASMWNTPDSAQFTINLNIVFPKYHEKWTGQPVPKNPASAAPIVHSRIGSLTHNGFEHWWTVKPDSHIEQISSEVESALVSEGLPFLDRHLDLDSLVHVAETTQIKSQKSHGVPAHPDLYLAILLTVSGNHSKATRVMRKLATENKLASFDETIKLIAQRLGIDIADVAPHP